MQLMTANKNKNYTAIYCRLSQEDSGFGDSQSIQNQKQYLRKYVLEQGWQIYDIYVDDGYSGTNFDRPAFKQMIDDIKAGLINIVVTKDLSRLGRNYIETGRYTEQFFPEHNVRYIAVNDNVDTNNEQDMDFAPFKNIMNEYYAKDISKKIRYTLQNDMKNGKPVRTTIPIYGYTFDKKSVRIPDPETAPIVKYIFKRFLETKSTLVVAEELKDRKVVIPLYKHYLNTGYHEERFKNYTDKQKYAWTRQHIYKILTKREYKGDYIRGRFKTKFKLKTKRRAKPDELYIFEHKFEALVSEEDFEKVQEILHKNLNYNQIESFNIYRGLVKCGICGHALRIATVKETGKIRVFCRQKEGMDSPTIGLDELNKIVSDDINQMKKYILRNERKFLDRVQEYIDKQPIQKLKNQRLLKINELKDKIETTKTQEKNVFEDYHKGLLSRSTYLDLLDNYSKIIQDTEKELRVLEINNPLDENGEIDYSKEALKFIQKLKNFEFDLINNSAQLSTIYESIYIKCKPEIVKNYKRPVIITLNIKGIDDIVRGYIDEENRK